MDKVTDVLNIEQQIEELSRYEGKALALDIYIGSQAVATSGSTISEALISKLRRKLADAGVAAGCIRGLRGHGYVLDTAVIHEP